MSLAYYTGVTYVGGTMTYNNITWTTTPTTPTYSSTVAYDFSYNNTNTLASSTSPILNCIIPYTFTTATSVTYKFSLPLGNYDITIAGGTNMFYTFSVVFFMFNTGTTASYFAYIEPSNTSGSLLTNSVTGNQSNLNYYINPSGASAGPNNNLTLTASTSFLNNLIPYTLITVGVPYQSASNSIITIYKTR